MVKITTQINFKAKPELEKFLSPLFEAMVNDTIIEEFKSISASEGRSSEYANSIRFIKTETLGGFIEQDYKSADGASIAIFVEEDTKPHDIEGNPLAFKGTTSINTPTTVFTNLVRHPGTTGQHIFARAISLGMPKLRKRIHRVLEKRAKEGITI